jgi:hypothetical protein
MSAGAGRRKITAKDMVIGVFIVITTGLILGILLEGFLSL